MNDEQLDTRLHEWAAWARETASQVRPSDPGHRNAKWLAVAASIAVVLAAAATIVITRTAHRTPAAQPTVPVAPPGRQLVTVHGLTITVPKSWPVRAYPCLPAHDAVATASYFAFCPAELGRANATIVAFYDLDGVVPRGERTAIAGRPALRTVLGDGVLLSVPSLDISVQVTSPDRQRVTSLIATLTVQPVDANGCRSHTTALRALPTGRPPTRPGAESALLPGDPSSVRVCRYHDGYIEQSATLNSAQTGSLKHTLDALPTGLSESGRRAYPNQDTYLVQADYPAGPSVTVDVRLNGAGQLGASNGTRTAPAFLALSAALARLAGA